MVLVALVPLPTFVPLVVVFVPLVPFNVLLRVSFVVVLFEPEPEPEPEPRPEPEPESDPSAQYSAKTATTMGHTTDEGMK